MSKFNLEDYETVEERIARFYEQYPDARIVTHNITTASDRTVGMWVVKATAYLTAGDQAEHLPKATGHAFEIDGQGMANKTAALENCETSAIGRALANLGMSGNKGRVTREEMEKVERGVTPKPVTDWNTLLDETWDIDELRKLYIRAKSNNVPKDILERIKAKANADT